MTYAKAFLDLQLQFAERVTALSGLPLARALLEYTNLYIRFGLGRWTTDGEVDYVIEKLTSVVRRLREMSPLYEMAKEGIDLSKMQWVTH